MKKIMLSSALLLGLVVAASTTSHAETKIVNGEETTSIPVKGYIGEMNTIPDNPGEIPEGDPMWINVEVPTSTIFTGKEGMISSPEYTITNRSGRPVEVIPVSFTSAGGDITSAPISDLEVDVMVDGALMLKVIENGQAAGTFSGLSTPLATLANNEGKMTMASTPVADSQMVTFKYSGNYSNFTGTATEDYTMTLKFEVPTNW